MIEHEPPFFISANVEVRESQFCLSKACEVSLVEPSAFRVHMRTGLSAKDESLTLSGTNCAFFENSLTCSIALLRVCLRMISREPAQHRHSAYCRLSPSARC